MGFWHAATNTQLIYSDDAYSMALLFYNNVKAMARRGDPMARELSATLKTYFKRKRSDKDEPTQKELLRDIYQKAKDFLVRSLRYAQTPYINSWSFAYGKTPKLSGAAG
jgi:hypothetical protein